ncbi:MAG: zinc metallopeptidase, partial [Planctomycetota bacterium]
MAWILFVFLPTLVLTGLASLWVKSSIAKYSKIPNSSGVTGAEAAAGILYNAGIMDVEIHVAEGFLGDHYDPTNRVIRLSRENFTGRSIAAVGIAAHEAGHAIQHAKNFAPLAIRNAAVPLASFGSSFGWIIMMMGLMMQGGVNVAPHPVTLA